MASLRASISGKTDHVEPVTNFAEEIPSLNPETTDIVRVKESKVHSGIGTMLFAVTLSLFWVGAASAFLWGYFGPQGLLNLGPHLLAFAAIVTFLPPFLFVAAAFAISRALAMGDTARRLEAAAARLTHSDESAVASAQTLGRAIRRELDTLSTGLDAALGRLRALENVLEDRVAQLDDANARADVKTQAIAQRLREERQGIEDIAATLDQTAARASETLEHAASRASENLAGRAAQLKALMEQAGGELRAAGQLLDTQGASFREAAEKAASAPVAAALELDRQAKEIASVADNIVGRAEFVLGRQERQRTGMNELLARLKQESASFEKVLETQQRAIERAAELLATEAKRLDTLTDSGMKRVEAAMGSAQARSTQLASGFGRDADHVRHASEAAATAMSRLIVSLREAAASAQALMDETTAEAKKRSREFVGEAMGSSDHLLRAAAHVAEQAEKARAALARAADEAERHIIALPGVAAQEAERVRLMVRSETEKMLDMSARTLATMQTRTVSRNAANEKQKSENDAAPESMGEGLRGLAKRITQPKKRSEPDAARASFELSAVLAAAETPDDTKPQLRPNAISALGSLQAALADIASDLEITMDGEAGPDLWRRYLDGDRGVFARKFASAIGPDSVDRITALYRDNSRFHAAADAYLEEFETLLARAREGDRDGFLASTLLGADTGKIYLVVAYALGRLE
jgi:hypothetical protein